MLRSSSYSFTLMNRGSQFESQVEPQSTPPIPVQYDGDDEGGGDDGGGDGGESGSTDDSDSLGTDDRDGNLDGDGEGSDYHDDLAEPLLLMSKENSGSGANSSSRSNSSSCSSGSGWWGIQKKYWVVMVASVAALAFVAVTTIHHQGGRPVQLRQ